MDLTFDLPGKIRNTRLYSSQALKPLFEAVANSIQAIEDAKEPNGFIEIRIDRGEQPALIGGTHLVEPVNTFSITDNGVGFTDDNYRSFFTAESTFKAARGCKGVGRFVWLKAFRHVDIESTYRGRDGKPWFRKFRFSPDPQQPEPEPPSPTDLSARRTTVRLVGMQNRFKEAGPKTAETIAQRVVEYCLPHFVHKKAPRMVLIDSDDTPYNLNDIFQELTLYEETDKFTLSKVDFQITHLLVPASREQVHRLHLCANGWSVKGEPLAERIPELRSQSSPLRDTGHGGRQLFYCGFLSGALLDESVSVERIDFALDDEPGMFSGLTKSVLLNKAVEKIDRYLTPYLTEVREQRKQQVQDHVYYMSPQYRPLLKHRPEVIETIPPNLPSDKLELKLYEANQYYNIELNAEYHRLLEEQDESAVDLDKHTKRVAAFLEEWNEEGMAKLAWHVAHRQATLSFLEQELGKGVDGKYRLESAIHRVIFPLKTTSDDVRWDQQNLWILDERLTYHYYLASDVPMKKVKPAQVKTDDRPDILVFNRPIAVVDTPPDYGSVVIFEFKRAMRDDYTEGDNPVLQVINYVKKLKTGKEVDRNGRPIPTGENTQYYGYVVCDVTPKLEELAELYGLKRTPDGKGFFGAHPSGVYLEIIPFWKLLADARQRNKRLFELLGFRQFPARPSAPSLLVTSGS